MRGATIKEFVTAIEDAFEPIPTEGSELVLDGQALHYFKPTDGQFALYVAATGRHSSDTDRMAGVIDFFMDLFDEPSQQYLARRLHNRNDPFGLPKIEEMMEAIIEEWTGRPMQRPRDSGRSRTSGGRKSTRTTPASTSSTKALTAS